MENMEGKFYCYSYRMYHFMLAFGEKCIDSSVSKSTGKRYWVFNKSDRLDSIIQKYNEMKHQFS